MVRFFGLLLLFAAASAGAQQPAGARQVFDGAMLPGVEVVTFEHSDTLVQRDGFIDGQQIVPAGWFQQAGSAH